jgi:raffinose/stachyose/melibiose transport system permease protein
VKRSRRIENGVLAAAFLLPAIALYSLFFAFPVVRALVVSLFDWNGFSAGMEFVGLANFANIAQDSLFWEAIGRTLIISVGGGVLLFGLVLFLGGVLLRPLRFKRIFRAILFFPVVLPGIAVGIIWAFVYNYDWGPVSGVAGALGLEFLQGPWLSPDRIIPALTVAVVWTYAGYYLLLVLAGIDRVPRDLLEAARIDGAGEWTTYRRVVLPMVRDVMDIALILWIVGSLRIFDVIAAITLPMPSTSTYTLSIYVWSQTVGGDPPVFRLGYGTALGVVLLALAIIGAGLSRFRGSRQRIEY